jgi:hypothetical protein
MNPKDEEVVSKKSKKETKKTHVVLRPPGTFLCLRCGESYAMELPAPVDVMVGAMKAFNTTHKKCTLNKVRGLACAFCFGFGHTEEECPKRKYHGDYREWLAGPDTGASSRALCRKLTSVMTEPFPPTPLDPDDFGRCHRLLHAIPGWRARIGEMRGEVGWTNLVDAWDELEALYLEELPSGRCPKLYARMKALAT